MGIIVVVVLVALAASAISLVSLGFRSPPPLAHFESDQRLANRHLRAQADSVQQAYARAADDTAGVRVIESLPGLLYLDSRPTLRVLSGDFGVAVLLRFIDGPTATTVVVEAQAKVLGPTRASTLRGIEHALRRRAIASGLDGAIG